MELAGALTGDRHVGAYASDGRLFVTFRDTTLDSPTKGDWVAWVGRFEDIVNGRQGQYRVRLMDNTKATDCCYPGFEVLPGGTLNIGCGVERMDALELDLKALPGRCSGCELAAHLLSQPCAVDQ